MSRSAWIDSIQIHESDIDEFPNQERRMKAFPLWTAILYLVFAPSFCFAGNLPRGPFWVGYNEAWFGANYGTWLTSNPFYQAASRFETTLGVIDAWFAGMAKGNAKIVRIWVFPQLQGIVLGPSRPRTQRLTSDFARNLNIVFTKAEKHGLKVYVTVLNGNDMTAAVGHPRLQAYYTNLLLNKYGEREAFKARIFGPLLNIMNNFNMHHPNVIFGLDLMNEIEAPIRSNYFPQFWQDARHWIENMTAFVKSKSPWLPVTSSAGWDYSVLEITLGLFSGLGLDFYDLHVYADSGKFSGLTALCDKIATDRVPIILGEYGQKSQTYDDVAQLTSTATFLYEAKSHCFSGALAWKYEEPTQTWLTHLRPDGTFRPAYYAIQFYGLLP
jgi:hypothetical protein